MLPFSFWSPTYFAFGPDTELQTGALAKRFGATKVLLHYGGGSVVKSGLLQKVRSNLEAEGIACVELGGVVPNPFDDKVYEGIELARRAGVDFIVAVGGGSAIDSAKAIAAGVPYSGDFWELFETKQPLQDALPLGTVLTLPATGSEASAATVITRRSSLLKTSIGSDLLRPKFSVLNPNLTMTLPAEQTAAGIADMMAHIFERYLSPTPDVDLTDRMSEAVLNSIMAAAQEVWVDPNNYEARATLMWAGMLAHNNLLGLGKVQDWSSHRIDHELSALYNVTHGAGLAVIFPAFMRYTLHADVARYAQLARRVMGVVPTDNAEADALEGINRLEVFFRSLELPTKLSELNIPEKDIPMLAARVNFLPEEDKLGAFMPLTRADIEKILLIAKQ